MSIYPSSHELAPDHNGIVWLSGRRLPAQGYVFNEPWMDKINPKLLIRYWRRKGAPGYLYTWHLGVKLWHRCDESGEIMTFVVSPMFT